MLVGNSHPAVTTQYQHMENPGEEQTHRQQIQDPVPKNTLRTSSPDSIDRYSVIGMSPSRVGTYTVCVYGSSSVNTPEQYLKISRKLGNVLADGGHMTVNGAGRSGCMGALNDGVTERCGRVRGVIHRMWVVDRAEHPDIKDLEVVEGSGLQERKRVLMENADCIIALPGGLGTWDELWEMVCLKGIGLCKLPICVLDVDDFYEGFRMQMTRAQTDRLLYADMEKLLHYESDPEKALAWCVSQLADNARTTSDVHPIKRKVDEKPIIRASSSWRTSDRIVWVFSVVAVSSFLSLAAARLKV